MIRRYPIRVLTDLSACRYDNGPAHAMRAMHVLLPDDDPEENGGSALRRVGSAEWEGRFDGQIAMGIVLYP